MLPQKVGMHKVSRKEKKKATMFLMSFGDDDAYITYMLQQQKPAGSQIPFSLLWEKRANDAVKTFNVNITSSASYS